MQRPKSSVCVICGVRPSTTRDHIPPRGFFKGSVGQFLTVPACRFCNNGSSEDDEILRNFISAQVGMQTSNAKKLWEMGARKSLAKSKKIRSAFLRRLKEVVIENGDGSTVTRLTLDIPISLYQRVFERVTRGFFFLHSGKILPTDSPVRVDLLTSLPDPFFFDLQLSEVHSIMKDVFEYRFCLDPKESSNGIWLFNIYGSQWIQSTTGKIVADLALHECTF